VAEIANAKFIAEMRDGNDERAYLTLEEWFQQERRSIGTLAEKLSEHYASYLSEPEFAHSIRHRRFTNLSVAPAAFPWL
jgi:hypothetical protein